MAIKEILKSTAQGIVGKNLKRVAGNLGSLIGGSQKTNSSDFEGINRSKSATKMLSFPLDVVNADPATGGNHGHYIMFESGFVGYSPQTSGFLEMSKDRGGHPLHRSRKLTSKLPDRSIVTSAVALYMPQSVKVGYSQNYDSDTETGLAGTAEATGMAIGDAEGAAAKVQAAMQGIVGGVATQAKEILGEFISLAGMGDPVRFAAKRAGVAVNPRNEAFYSSPSQRTFSFEFDFWPRNAKEAQAVEDIILIFKYNSAPGFADKTQQSVFTTPNYWKVSYMYNGGENPHLNKIGACFCTDVQVDYAPDGQFTTFGGEITKGGGVPVHTKLTVSMLEDRIITKTDIEAGA